jgi:predicted GNAT family N-acyltransferase
VLRDQRGTGLGAALIRAGVAHFRARGDIARVRLGAQTHALGFYAGLGFRAVGDDYMDAGIPHRDMVLDLTG